MLGVGGTRYVATRRSKEMKDPMAPRENKFVEMATDNQAPLDLDLHARAHGRIRVRVAFTTEGTTTPCHTVELLHLCSRPILTSERL